MVVLPTRRTPSETARKRHEAILQGFLKVERNLSGVQRHLTTLPICCVTLPLYGKGNLTGRSGAVEYQTDRESIWSVSGNQRIWFSGLFLAILALGFAALVIQTGIKAESWADFGQFMVSAMYHKLGIIGASAGTVSV